MGAQTGLTITDTALGVHRRGARRHRGHDLRSVRRLEAGPTVIGGLPAKLAGSAWARAALRYGLTALAMLLFLLALRHSGERAGRLAQRLETMEKTHDAQRRILEAAARRLRSRDDLAERLRDGRF
jgi:hypothetical protein